MDRIMIEKMKAIQSKITTGGKFSTEEATKNGLVLPLISALGYNVFDTDEVTPEDTADFANKKGEKVDYAVKINGQTVMLIECKQLSVSLSSQHIGQLYRYFTTSDVHIAVLTNGNDYWFFTDSEKKNIMDREPYMKLHMGKATVEELAKFEDYKKENISKLDVAKGIQYSKFEVECTDFINDLVNGNISSWVIDKLEELAGIKSGDRVIMAKTLNRVTTKYLKNVVTKNKKVSSNDENVDLEEKKKLEKDYEKASEIKLGTEYVFDDYTDGNWMFHTLDYAIIIGEKMDGVSAADVLCKTIEMIACKGDTYREIIIREMKNRVYNGLEESNNAVGKVRYLESCQLGVQIKIGWNEIVKTMAKVLDLFEIEHSEIKLSFKK